MTFYDLIRNSLLEDAKKHPYPGKGDGLASLIQKTEERQKQPEDRTGGSDTESTPD